MKTSSLSVAWKRNTLTEETNLSQVIEYMEVHVPVHIDRKSNRTVICFREADRQVDADGKSCNNVCFSKD